MVKYFCDRCGREAQPEEFKAFLQSELCPICQQEYQKWVRGGRTARQEALRQAVNTLLAEAEKFAARYPRFKNDSINWGDVRCIAIRQFTDGVWQVTVGEASPEAQQLREWLRDALADQGWNVEVVTEW